MGYNEALNTDNAYFSGILGIFIFILIVMLWFLLRLNHLFRLSKPSRIGAAFEHKGKSLSREDDPTLSPDKECLPLMQGSLLPILIF